MGRVVKGAPVASDAYEVKVPKNGSASRAPVPAFPLDEPVFAGAIVEETSPPEVDFAALHQEAAKILSDAGEDAERIVREAQERALSIIDEAESRVPQIEAEAKRDGFDQGRSDGLTAAQAEMDDMIETMRGLVEMALAERHKIIESAEPEIVKLAVAIAQRILDEQVAVHPDTVLQIARSAVSRLVSRETVTVRVNPADIETMRQHRERLMAMNDLDNMRMIEDRRVDRGGVVIETEAGTIDAKISTQLREVRRLLAVDEDLSVDTSSEAPIINPPAQAS
jgi:flagellar assembly protein FliH